MRCPDGETTNPQLNPHIQMLNSGTKTNVHWCPGNTNSTVKRGNLSHWGNMSQIYFPCLTDQLG